MKIHIRIIKKIGQWEAENTFYLKATPERISKFIAHYEIFNRVKNLRGDIVECGVFRGASLSRFMNFNKIFKEKKNFLLSMLLVNFQIVEQKKISLFLLDKPL